MELLFELLKYTVPGMIVFLTAYFMLKLYLDDQQKIWTRRERADAQKISLPLRLQAYERMTLLCDRVAIPNVMLRVRMPGMKMAELRAALLIAIRQEFEHNTSQQLYVSDTLWQIISVAKDSTLSLVTQAAEGLDPEASDEAYVGKLLEIADEQGYSSHLHKAIVAIRTEAGRLF